MFFYKEGEEAQAPSPTYSVSPDLLAFTSQGESKSFTFTVTDGPVAGGISIVSTNGNFSVSPSSVAGDVNSSTVSVTFNGNDQLQTGTISVLDSNSNVLATVSVDSSGYAGPGGDPFDPGGSAPPP